MKLLQDSVNISGLHTDGGYLKASVAVDDAAIRAEHPGFNGYERMFALVPRRQDGEVVWDRFDMDYKGSWSYGGGTIAGGTPQPTYDNHGLGIGIGVQDQQAIARNGVAFGMDTNVGTLWLQTAGDNYFEGVY